MDAKGFARCCDHKTVVIDSRTIKASGVIRRRRACVICDKRETTVEFIVPLAIRQNVVRVDKYLRSLNVALSPLQVEALKKLQKLSSQQKAVLDIFEAEQFDLIPREQPQPQTHEQLGLP